MSVYPDASFLVSLFVSDAMMARARNYLIQHKPALVVSDFASAEFVSAVSRRLRTGELSRAEAARALSNFDVWTSMYTERENIQRGDIATADAFLRRLDLVLRTPDAINIAIAQRLSAELATFDKGMIVAAKRLGLTVATP